MQPRQRIEVRFGRTTLELQDFMPLLRGAEQQVQQRYPRLRAEAVDPVRFSTMIGREYAAAAEIAFRPTDLLTFTRNAIEAAFVSEDCRASLLDELRGV